MPHELQLCLKNNQDIKWLDLLKSNIFSLGIILI